MFFNSVELSILITSSTIGIIGLILIIISVVQTNKSTSSSSSSTIVADSNLPVSGSFKAIIAEAAATQNDSVLYVSNEDVDPTLLFGEPIYCIPPNDSMMWEFTLVYLESPTIGIYVISNAVLFPTELVLTSTGIEIFDDAVITPATQLWRVTYYPDMSSDNIIGVNGPILTFQNFSTNKYLTYQSGGLSPDYTDEISSGSYFTCVPENAKTANGPCSNAATSSSSS